MKLILAVVLSLFATSVFADASADHRAALRKANVKFTAAFEACSDLPWYPPSERTKCRGVAKREHTKDVQRADKIMKQK